MWNASGLESSITEILSSRTVGVSDPATNNSISLHLPEKRNKVNSVRETDVVGGFSRQNNDVWTPEDSADG